MSAVPPSDAAPSAWTVAAPGVPGPGATVWTVDLAVPAGALAACATVLSSEEQARAGRFLRAQDRERFVVSHAALRLILGRALGRPPGALAFGAAPGGRPELAGPDAGRLSFNLSHSGARALVGLSAAGAIGVDVEAARPLPDALRIARGHFAPDEAQALAELPAERQVAAFLGLWTRKEAVVKALGAGLALPLDRFSLTLPPEPPRLLRPPEDAPAWTLAHLEPGPGTVGTAAIAAADVPVGLRTLPEDWTAQLADTGSA